MWGWDGWVGRALYASSAQLGRLIVFQQRAINVASISGLVVEYNVAIVVTRVRFPADALLMPLYFTGGDEKRRRRACL